jgi:hypothetical protein
MKSSTRDIQVLGSRQNERINTMQRSKLNRTFARFSMIMLLGALLAACNPTNPITPPDPPQPTGIYPWRVWTPEIPVVPPSSTGVTYYVDGTNGKDTNNGTTATTAFKTIAKAIEGLSAVDTVLIRKGLYREGIVNTPTGTASKPITFGSYGDGEVILDGSNKTGIWEQVNGTIWKTTKAIGKRVRILNPSQWSSMMWH